MEEWKKAKKKGKGRKKIKAVVHDWKESYVRYKILQWQYTNSFKKSKMSDTFQRRLGLVITVYLINKIPLKTTFLSSRQNLLLGKTHL
jgi:hypothetical protein